MTSRKTMEINITNKQAEKLYNSLINLAGSEFSGRWFEGSLVDEFAIGMTDCEDWKINLKKGRPILARKFVYAYEKYLNSGSSELILVLTDNEQKFKNFVKSRFENDEDLNEIDLEDFLYDCGLTD